MGSNITQIPGATEVEIYFRNYTYATAVSDLAALAGVHFTDLDRLGYKNTGGTLRKLMEDASGSSNIPDESVLIADSNGRVTFDANLTWDGTDLTIGSGYAATLSDGWSFHCTSTTLEIYKNGAQIGNGIIIAGV